MNQSHQLEEYRVATVLNIMLAVGKNNNCHLLQLVSVFRFHPSNFFSSP